MIGPLQELEALSTQIRRGVALRSISMSSTSSRMKASSCFGTAFSLRLFRAYAKFLSYEYKLDVACAMYEDWYDAPRHSSWGGSLIYVSYIYHINTHLSIEIRRRCTFCWL